MSNKWYKTESILMSYDYYPNTPNMKCCAYNSLGEECTELHHYGT